MTAFIDKFQRYCGSRSLAWLLVLNVVIFLATWAVILGGNSAGLPGNFTMPWLCVAAEPQVFLSHPWTLLTYMVTHYDFLHLLFNMLWLYWFGIILIPYAGRNSILWIYISGGILGALLYVAVNALMPSLQAPGAYLCGASASVLAVMSTAAIVAPNRPINLFLIGSVKLKWVAIACVALTFLGIGGGSPGAQSAHFGGVIAGLVFPFVALGKRLGKPSVKPAPSMPSPLRSVKIKIRRHNRDGAGVANAAAGRLSDASRLDQLLDKIRHSGYDSLTAGERNELNELSRRIDKIQNNN